MTRKLGSTDLKRLNREWRRRTTQRLGLILDDVASPFNVGAIIRTAAALRVDQVWLAGRTPDPRAPKVGKTALGTDRYLTFSREAKGAEAVVAAAAAGFTVVAVELTADATPIFEADLGADVALVMGHEDHGVSAAALEACAAAVLVPQAGKVGSLNVASAAAIALYEARRQGWATGQDRGRRPGG